MTSACIEPYLRASATASARERATVVTKASRTDPPGAQLHTCHQTHDGVEHSPDAAVESFSLGDERVRHLRVGSATEEGTTVGLVAAECSRGALSDETVDEHRRLLGGRLRAAREYECIELRDPFCSPRTCWRTPDASEPVRVEEHGPTGARHRETPRTIRFVVQCDHAQLDVIRCGDRDVDARRDSAVA